MSNTSITALGASELSRRIETGRLSSAELVDALLARILACNGRLGAFTEVYADTARQAAEAADLAIRSGHRIGPLHGLPIAIKDVFKIHGRVITGGSAIWRQRIAEATATTVRRLIMQGAIILGKTQAVEFSMGGWGTNQHQGTPHNPWDMKHARTPGGSSSGSAVALAAGMAPLALGSDTGGSVRTPAAWCNLSALKVSTGRISLHGVLPLSPTLDTVGPMARSVEDVSLLYHAIRGEDPFDPSTRGLPPDGGFDCQPLRDARGLRLGCLQESERDGVDPRILRSYDLSLQQFKDAGAEIIELALPHGFHESARLNGTIIAAEAYALLGEWVDNPALPLDEDVRCRILAGRDISAKDYLLALRARQAMQAELSPVFRRVDALLTPTTQTPALLLSEVNQNMAPSHFLRFGNFYNLPCLALPNGLTQSGLPISLQIIGSPYSENKILEMGRFYQTLSNWHEHCPLELQ